MTDGQSAPGSQFRQDAEFRTEAGGEFRAAYPGYPEYPARGSGSLDMIAVTHERLAASDRYLPAIPADSESRYFD